MNAAQPIADMHRWPLSAAAGETRLLREVDHVLRRFGQLSTETLAAGGATPYTLRAEADRVVFALDGRCQLRLLDLRPQSPSHAVFAQLALDAATPEGVLVPFGVACSLAASDAARVLWLSTHSAVHAGDRQASPAELAAHVPAGQR
ncbi:MAG: dTDP-4-dehydrorhamnose 3,5-epimerase family protein [Anaerolineales bacterium]|nr:dTDP-4-dehydrorhamnose 3,5-epimerase family protein [Anaerolineales bacterium]